MKLIFEISDPFVQLLTVMYARNSCIVHKIDSTGTFLHPSEKSHILNQYLPNVLDSVIFNLETKCEIDSRSYPFVIFEESNYDKNLHLRISRSLKDGETVQITNVNRDSMSVAFTLIDEFVKKISEAQVKKVMLNESYTAVYTKGDDFVQVGCQKIPVDAIDELYDKIHED